MSTGQFWELGQVTDVRLLDGVRKLVAGDRRVTARLLAHLSEVQERRLHLKQAKPTMFAYCLELGMSEDEAGRRLCAAGVAKRFPVAYGMLDQGKLCLSVLCELKHHLTDDNHLEVLEGVAGMSFRRAQEWLARRLPRPDAASRIRKLPDRSTHPEAATKPANPPQGQLPTAHGPATLNAHPPQAASGSSSPQPELGASRAAQQALTLPVTDRGRMEPLAANRYRVQFTAGTELKEKLELALDLAAHKNPHRDYAPIVERALDLLIAELEKQRFGKTARPHRSRSPKSDRVTNATKRAVAERDGLRCSFVDEQGRRCAARAFLERDHRIPRGKGGTSGPDNVRHMCRAHNQWLAEREYGRSRIELAKHAAREKAATGNTATSRHDSTTTETRVGALDTS